MATIREAIFCSKCEIRADERVVQRALRFKDEQRRYITPALRYVTTSSYVKKRRILWPRVRTTPLTSLYRTTPPTRHFITVQVWNAHKRIWTCSNAQSSSRGTHAHTLHEFRCRATVLAPKRTFFECHSRTYLKLDRCRASKSRKHWRTQSICVAKSILSIARQVHNVTLI